MLSLYLKGAGLGAGLIVAIGAQNAFVLRQGLRRQYVFAVALVCFLIDVTLYLIGAAGFGSLVAAFPALTTAAAWAGAAFMIFYGLMSFRSAYRGNHLEIDAEHVNHRSLRAVVLMTLAVSLLNPHVYLDTVVLVGGLAGQFPWDERVYFLFGAITTSLVWFFLLAYGASFLVPLFRRPLAWRALDAGIGLLMWGIAASLLLGGLV